MSEPTNGGANVPAVCGICGLVFFSSFSVGGDGRFLLQRNVSSCPRCGTPARFLDGEFRVVDDILELISGPDFSRSVLEEMRRILRQRRGGDIIAAQANLAALERPIGSRIDF